MTEYQIISRSIKAEADQLLENRGLLKVLSKYGDVKYTGSYRLDLMMKKDMDITLVSGDNSTEEFFRLGYEISLLFNAHSMFYRNTIIKSAANRPDNGLYWGIQFEDWNLDIWLLTYEEYEKSEKYIVSVLNSLDAEKIDTILRLKYELLEGPYYGRTFSSRELYDSVINHDVKTSEDLFRYLQEIPVPPRL